MNKKHEPLFACFICRDERTFPADHLRMQGGELWCADCWYDCDMDIDAGIEHHALPQFVPEADQKIQELERERNELAAQVERLRECVDGLISRTIGVQDGWDILKEPPAAALAELKAQWNCPTVEHGKNRYGLDVAYFRDLFNRELNRTLQDYRPHELARNLLRMARAADESVIAEPEFTGKLRAQWQADILARTSIQIAAGKPEATSIQIATALLTESQRIRKCTKEAQKLAEKTAEFAEKLRAQEAGDAPNP